METLFRDVRHGLALLSREKLFSAAAILTLGVAIGANITIFGVVDSVLLEPLPYENADRLATVYNSYPGAGVPRASSGVPDHLERRRDVEAFADAALYRFDSLSLGSETGRPERCWPSASPRRSFRSSGKRPPSAGSSTSPRASRATSTWWS